MSGEKKPVLRTVTITMTLAEASRVMGKEGGEWSKGSAYIDADSYDDVWHDGYRDSQVLGIDFREYVAEEAKNIFPGEVGVALEELERASIASKIGDARRDAVKATLEKIEVSGEYMSDDGEMISVGGAEKPGVVSVEIDVPGDSVKVKLKNPEHLVNDIVNGVGRWSPPFDPYEVADDDEIKAAFVACSHDYFDVYGDSPSSTDRMNFDPDVNDKDFVEAIKERLAMLSNEEVAERVVEAVDAGRFETYAEAAKKAAEVAEIDFKALKDAVKKEVATRGEKSKAEQEERMRGF